VPAVASELQLPILKNKIFLGKSSAAPASTIRGDPGSRDAPPLAGNASKQKHGAGVVRARPPHNYLAASKNKKENFKGRKVVLKLYFYGRIKA